MLAQEKVLVHDYPQEPKPDDSKAITLVETKNWDHFQFRSWLIFIFIGWFHVEVFYGCSIHLWCVSYCFWKQNQF